MKLATLCYIRNAAQTLMMHRGARPGDIHAGKWNGLGGKLEPGEDPDTCVRREVLEESGLQLDTAALVGVLTFPEFKDQQDWYVFVYVAREFSGQLRNGEEGELAWIDDSKLLDLNLWEGDRIFLPLVLEGKFFTGRFCYENKQLISHSLNVYDSSPGEIAQCVD